jgi:hypothetical protein
MVQDLETGPTGVCEDGKRPGGLPSNLGGYFISAVLQNTVPKVRLRERLKIISCAAAASTNCHWQLRYAASESLPRLGRFPAPRVGMWRARSNFFIRKDKPQVSSRRKCRCGLPT